jgi:hypothetical protein
MMKDLNTKTFNGKYTLDEYNRISSICNNRLKLMTTSQYEGNVGERREKKISTFNVYVNYHKL